jgi:hypothetical protein
MKAKAIMGGGFCLQASYRLFGSIYRSFERNGYLGLLQEVGKQKKDRRGKNG